MHVIKHTLPFTTYKAAKIIGIPCENHRVISTHASSEYSLNAIDVRSAIETDVANGLIPLYLCATIGTTAIGAADCLVKLGQEAKEYGIWLHVDAAYAGSACIYPEFRHYLNGIELAESLCISAHKWLLTNLDCTCLWVKNSSLLTDSLCMNPEYLRNKASETKQVVDYKRLANCTE